MQESHYLACSLFSSQVSLYSDKSYQACACTSIILIAGTTLGLVGVEEALNQAGISVRMTYVSKEKLVKDMQFRGAISDFHPIKEHIMKSDYDPLLLRTNEDDLYGDGNNFEVQPCCISLMQAACLVSSPTYCSRAVPCMPCCLGAFAFGVILGLNVGTCLQLATLRSAAEVWEFIDAETERRKQQAESAVTEQKAAKGLAPSQKTWIARPWQSLVCN